MKTKLPIIGLLYLTLISCTVQSTNNQLYDKEVVRQEMKNLVLSYGQAVEQMDIEKTISHFNDDSEFYVYSDGRHFTYAQITKAVRNDFFRGLKKVELNWDTLNVRAVGSHEAVCFAILHQTLLDSAENTFKVRVETTFVGVKNCDHWKIAYVHSRHE